MAEELLSTDEEILESIGEGVEPVKDETTTEEVGKEATTTDEPAKEVAGTVAKEKAPPQGPQDLVGKDGKVLAASGKERRFYETAQREKTRADTASKENVELKAKIEAFTSAGSVGTQYNLTPEEVTTGAQLMASYKKDPVGTIKYMLTQAQASGHNIDDIGGGTTNMEAIKQMLETAINPLMVEQKEREETKAANDRAQETYNTFVAQHPDGAVHEASLARLLQDDSNLSLEAAYYKLQNYYLSKQLDWTKPLEVLLKETKQAPNVNTQQTLPDGSVNPNTVTDTPQVADVNTSYDDLIRASIAEAGIT